MAADKNAVILYGGSFNPPHSGHISLAEAAYKQIKPDFFYFVPNFHSPFKEMQPASFNDRSKMLHLAAGEKFMSQPGVRISSWEEDQRKIVYTWKTIRHFRKIHPNSKIYFLMGSDCLRSFNDWQRSRDILKNASLLVGIRPGFNIIGGEAPFVPLKGLFPESASSGIRTNIILNRKTSGICLAVREYIRKRGLYFSQETNMLRKELSPRRYRHCVNVARCAVNLAHICAVPEYQAAIAGLLHDCARELDVEVLKAMRISGPILGRYRKDVVKYAPKLLHASAGAMIARERFGIKDKMILQAIHLHATGMPDMNTLSKIIYMSDYLSAERNFVGLDEIRQLAEKDFDAAFAAIVEAKAKYREERKFWAHPLSIQLWKQVCSAKEN